MMYIRTLCSRRTFKSFWLFTVDYTVFRRWNSWS